mmetsp:Transcript_11660/g.41649  ORF Transcript_11660/g.41649 Transcript_11660/m.41649 type:complete len:203 (+) Transcript_11660:1057-1665(+)
MSLPLLQIIRKDERQWIPRRWEVDGDVSLNAPLPDQLQHPYLGVHGDAVESVRQAPILQRRFVVHHSSAGLPNEDRRHLVRGLDGLDGAVLQLLRSGDGHTHVVRGRRHLFITAHIRVHGAHPVHVAENRLEEVHNGLGVLRGDVILALQLWLDEATTVDVAGEISLRPTEQSFCGHVAGKPWILLHGPPGKRVGINHLLCT